MDINAPTTTTNYLYIYKSNKERGSYEIEN